jgi:hypothetical protein
VQATRGPHSSVRNHRPTTRPEQSPSLPRRALSKRDAAGPSALR